MPQSSGSKLLMRGPRAVWRRRQPASRGRSRPPSRCGNAVRANARGQPMNDFVPPFPARPKQPLSAFATLRLARRNFLAIWEERSFEWEVFSTRLLSRTLFVCNSPDTVASAFVERHDSFERKSPQMRHALAPLLGDGLFISDGETWRRRRRIVAPIVHVSHLPLFAPLMV